jgi:hypothetical protein
MAGIRGDHAFRFFVAPTATSALGALGFEVTKEETSWWRTLPATHRIWCRRNSAPPADPIVADADYLEPPADLLELRSLSASEDNRLAPLLILAEMGQRVLPSSHQAIDARLPPRALRAVDSVSGPDVDWGLVEHEFARFVAALDRSPSPLPANAPRDDAIDDDPPVARGSDVGGGLGRRLTGHQHGCDVRRDRPARAVAGAQ